MSSRARAVTHQQWHGTEGRSRQQTSRATSFFSQTWVQIAVRVIGCVPVLGTALAVVLLSFTPNRHGPLADGQLVGFFRIAFPFFVLIWNILLYVVLSVVPHTFENTGFFQGGTLRGWLIFAAFAVTQVAAFQFVFWFLVDKDHHGDRNHPDHEQGHELGNLVHNPIDVDGETASAAQHRSSSTRRSGSVVGRSRPRQGQPIPGSSDWDTTAHESSSEDEFDRGRRSTSRATTIRALLDQYGYQVPVAQPEASHAAARGNVEDSEESEGQMPRVQRLRARVSRRYRSSQ